MSSRWKSKNKAARPATRKKFIHLILTCLYSPVSTQMRPFPSTCSPLPRPPIYTSSLPARSFYVSSSFSNLPVGPSPPSVETTNEGFRPPGPVPPGPCIAAAALCCVVCEWIGLVGKILNARGMNGSQTHASCNRRFLSYLEAQDGRAVGDEAPAKLDGHSFMALDACFRTDF